MNVSWDAYLAFPADFSGADGIIINYHAGTAERVRGLTGSKFSEKSPASDKTLIR